MRKAVQRILFMTLLAAPMLLPFVGQTTTALAAGPSNGPTAVNAQNYTTTPSGLRFASLRMGQGEVAKKGQLVKVHYTGWLENGTKFDSSHDRNQPFQFKLGAGNVIKGWDEGVAGMKVGELRQLKIPASLAYGAKGAGGKIPPNAPLTFQVELLEVGH